MAFWTMCSRIVAPTDGGCVDLGPGVVPLSGRSVWSGDPFDTANREA